MGDESPRQCIIPLHKPSGKELVFFFISGVVVSIPMAYFFENVTAFVPAIVLVSVLAPFIEELAKVFPLFYRHGETEKSIVTLGILVGLGFGISELAEYVFIVHVPLIARIPAVIFHASSAAIVAYGIAKKNPWPFYMISVSLHAVNNFFAAINISAGVFVELVVVIIAYVLAWSLYHAASTEKIVV